MCMIKLQHAAVIRKVTQIFPSRTRERIQQQRHHRRTRQNARLLGGGCPSGWNSGGSHSSRRAATPLLRRVELPVPSRRVEGFVETHRRSLSRSRAETPAAQRQIGRNGSKAAFSPATGRASPERRPTRAVPQRATAAPAA